MAEQIARSVGSGAALLEGHDVTVLQVVASGGVDLVHREVELVALHVVVQGHHLGGGSAPGSNLRRTRGEYRRQRSTGFKCDCLGCPHFSCSGVCRWLPQADNGGAARDA